MSIDIKKSIEMAMMGESELGAFRGFCTSNGLTASSEMGEHEFIAALMNKYPENKCDSKNWEKEYQLLSAKYLELAQKYALVFRQLQKIKKTLSKLLLPSKN